MCVCVCVLVGNNMKSPYVCEVSQRSSNCRCVDLLVWVRMHWYHLSKVFIVELIALFFPIAVLKEALSEPSLQNSLSNRQFFSPEPWTHWLMPNKYGERSPRFYFLNKIQIAPAYHWKSISGLVVLDLITTSPPCLAENPPITAFRCEQRLNPNRRETF